MSSETIALSEPLLSLGIEPSRLKHVLPLFKLVTFTSNETILSAGDRWKSLSVIQQGIVRLYYLDSNGKESNKGFYHAKQILAPIARSAIEQPVKFYIEALTDVVVYQCHYGKLSAVLDGGVNAPTFFQQLTEQLLEDKINRELMFLQLDARKRYQAFQQSYPALSQQIPLRHIASYLGMTDVTLSRIRHS